MAAAITTAWLYESNLTEQSDFDLNHKSCSVMRSSRWAHTHAADNAELAFPACDEDTGRVQIPSPQQTHLQSSGMMHDSCSGDRWTMTHRKPGWPFTSDIIHHLLQFLIIAHSNNAFPLILWAGIFPGEPLSVLGPLYRCISLVKPLNGLIFRPDTGESHRI